MPLAPELLGILDNATTELVGIVDSMEPLDWITHVDELVGYAHPTEELVGVVEAA